MQSFGHLAAWILSSDNFDKLLALHCCLVSSLMVYSHVDCQAHTFSRPIVTIHDHQKAHR